ncbi:Splicing factor 3B subunit 5 [Chytriomyces hyalinus]|nr:Splicing factor 3B subunit 5 [Chytriomyces hyalinus]
MSQNSQLEHLQSRFVGTGHADTIKFEWLQTQHRDTAAACVGHGSLAAYFAVAENESIGRVRFNLIESPFTSTMTRIDIDQLLSDLDATLSEVSMDRADAGYRDSGFEDAPEFSTHHPSGGLLPQRTRSLAGSVHARNNSSLSISPRLPPLARSNSHSESFVLYSNLKGGADNVKILAARDQVRIRMEKERQEYMANLATFQHIQSNSPTDSFESGLRRNASFSSSSSSSTHASRIAAKNPTGWSGRSSQRIPSKISDLLIDKACNLDVQGSHLQQVIWSLVGMIKEFYSTPTNKGQGANQAIMAAMYVINLEDPNLVKRGLEVLDMLCKFAGPVLWVNLALNLDFFQHFLETRKHTTADEKKNVTLLCGLFAGWVTTLQASAEDLAAAGNLKDPLPKIRDFFEGLVRAGYDFPDGSLDNFSDEEMAAIHSWSVIRRGFTFASVRKHK